MVTKVFYPQKPKPESVSDLDSDSSSLPSSYTDQMASGDFSTPQRKMKSSQVFLLTFLWYTRIFWTAWTMTVGLPLTTSLLQRRWDSQETLNSPDSSQTHLPEKRKQIKLAIGILFTTGNEQDTEEQKLFQSFFFAHMALIEGHVERLRSTVEKAIFTGRNMVPSIYEALDKFRDALYDLYMAPRLREPVWLSMMSLGSYRYVLCERFVHEFMALAAKYDNKSTKFFVSTLLSAVLTYHLAWVATVTPGDGTPSKTYLDKHSAKWIDTLAKTHPYNPLWAQLGDLYGAIGYPLKVARTVVVGRKADIVKKFLYVLSYFIRCSDVHEAPYVNCLPSILDDLSHSQPDRTEADNRSTECRVLAVGIVEDSRVESIPHLQRSMDSLNRYDSLPPESDSAYASLNPDSLGVDSKLDSNTKRPLSVLAQQLAADRESNTNLEQQKLKMSEVRKQFLSGGSSISMYDEYYDGVTETKTIDMVSEEQRVVKHPLACSAATSSTSSKGEVWSGETGSSQQKVSVSRQNSVDTKPHVSRPTSLNPARCRLKTQGEQSSIEAYDQNFGRSLLAGYSDHYMSDFVLHGTSDTSFRQKLLQDLQATMQASL
nr:hypothetical protein BaRGS_019884 [Batillaria attramentaria]